MPLEALSFILIFIPEAKLKLTYANVHIVAELKIFCTHDLNIWQMSPKNIRALSYASQGFVYHFTALWV